MTDDTQTTSIKPHFIIVAVVVIVLLVVFLWPSEEEAPVAVVEEPVAEEAVPVVEAPIEEPEPEVFEATPEPEAVELSPTVEPEPMPEPIEIEPEPVDISDAAIETALVTIANSDAITSLLVDEALLQRFVVTITNLADDEMAPNHRLLNPPTKTFRVYQQAEREWIDPASYKRYTPYVDAMEAMDNERLLTLFERYESEMTNTYEEIATSRQSFTETMVDAIDTLLDTPEVPVPVEVYTDSVAYKYKDERLESLSGPQKQLLRTGPDNMRRVKAKLREIKALLQERES